MKWKTAVALGLAVGCLLGLRVFRLSRKNRQLEIFTDLGYKERSPQELISAHLLDLNTAAHEDLLGLGLNQELIDKVIENRPYRNKLDLLSRMVIPEHAYEAIKHQVGIANATELLKVGS
jgi:Helix-hairpin-helix motif